MSKVPLEALVYDIPCNVAPGQIREGARVPSQKVFVFFFFLRKTACKHAKSIAASRSWSIKAAFTKVRGDRREPESERLSLQQGSAEFTIRPPGTGCPSPLRRRDDGGFDARIDWDNREFGKSPRACASWWTRHAARASRSMAAAAKASMTAALRGRRSCARSLAHVFTRAVQAKDRDFWVKAKRPMFGSQTCHTP